MNFLPVAHRELRMAAAQPRTYRGRVLSALVVVLISLSMLYAGFGRALNVSSAGRNLFLILSAIAAAYVLLDGVMLTADCVSQEKREGTLGLLFLTDLRGYDVVAGKLISRAANAAYCLMAALPALGIGLFLGGVSGQEFFRVTVALLNGLFFSAALGMFVSALAREERRAMGLALLGVLTWSVLIPMLGWGLSVYQQTGVIHPLFLVTSPAGSFLSGLFDSTPGTTTLGYDFGQSLALSHALGWCLLAAASLVLPHAWRDKSPRQALKGLFSPAKAAQARLRRAGLDENPLLSAGERPVERSLGFWPIFLVVCLGWAVGWALGRSQWLSLPVYVTAVALLHLGLVYAVTITACRRPGHDQRSGVLEILLTTPGGEDMYRRGRLLSLKRRSLVPVLIVLAADGGVMAAGCWASGPLNWEWLGWIVAFVALAVKLLIDLYTVSWVGFWQGLKTGNAGRALRNTVFQVFVVRWILLMAILAVLGAVTDGQLYRSEAGMIVGVAGYLVLVGMTSLHYCGKAMTELQDNLRTLTLDLDAAAEVAGSRSRTPLKRGAPVRHSVS
jgi:hypothetical protein